MLQNLYRRESSSPEPVVLPTDRGRTKNRIDSTSNLTNQSNKPIKNILVIDVDDTMVKTLKKQIPRLALLLVKILQKNTIEVGFTAVNNALIKLSESANNLSDMAFDLNSISVDTAKINISDYGDIGQILRTANSCNIDEKEWVNLLTKEEQEKYPFDSFKYKKYEIFNDVIKNLTALKDNGTAILSCSNGSIWKKAELNKLLCSNDIFDEVVASADKPNPTKCINGLSSISRYIVSKKIPVYVVGDCIRNDIGLAQELQEIGYNATGILIDRNICSATLPRYKNFLLRNKNSKILRVYSLSSVRQIIQQEQKNILQLA